jgi:hypothetical protein
MDTPLLLSPLSGLWRGGGLPWVRTHGYMLSPRCGWEISGWKPKLQGEGGADLGMW